MTAGTIGAGGLGSQPLAAVHSDSLDPAWKARVRVTVHVVAQEVMAEAGTVTNDTNRRALASQVAKYLSDQQVEAFALAALSDLTTTRAATDQALLTRIEALWDQVAGT